MALRRLDLPNIITVARILACPLLFVLTLAPRADLLYLAFVVFVAAALSDLWDGYLARKHGWITDTGKLLDPVADKLLLFSTFVPFYIVSHGDFEMLGWAIGPPAAEASEVPIWGPLPLWLVVIVFGREIAVTVFRWWAARRGSVLSAGSSGKIKAFTQNIFSGALILWYALLRTAESQGWETAVAWRIWAAFHGFVVAVSLAIALFLTVYSMAVYYWQNRSLVHSIGT